MQPKKPNKEMAGLQHTEQGLVHCADAKGRQQAALTIGEPFGGNDSVTVFMIISPITWAEQVLTMALMQ